jgi:hypothetical protein
MSKILGFIFLLIGFMILGLAPSVCAITGDVEKSFPSPASCPTGLTFDGKYLWNCDRKTDMIYKIDPENGRFLVFTRIQTGRLDLGRKISLVRGY